MERVRSKASSPDHRWKPEQKYESRYQQLWREVPKRRCAL